MKIEIKKIQKKYGKKEVLKDCSFSAESGQCIGILGENGCGKSSIFNLILGLAGEEFGGTVKINDIEIHSIDMEYLIQRNILLSAF